MAAGKKMENEGMWGKNEKEGKREREKRLKNASLRVKNLKIFRPSRRVHGRCGKK